MNRKINIFKIIEIILIILFVIWSVFPIYLIISNSFKATLDIKEMPPKWIFKPTLTHYKRIIGEGDFLCYFKNSLIVALSTTAISLFGGTLSAYGLLLCRNKLASRISNMMLISKLVPAIAVLIPFFTLLQMAHLGGGYLGPILAHSSINLPFVIWLMLSFMTDLPRGLLESAVLEGATRMQTFWRIVFPMLKPASGSVIILVMQFSWNDLIYALQLTSMKSYTLPVGIARYVGSVSVDWGKSSAAATITMIPIIIVGFLMQRHLVTGLTAGAVKGGN